MASLFQKLSAFFAALGNLIARFLMSAAAPFVFGAVGLVLLFFLLRYIYRVLRDKHLPDLSYERSFSEPGVFAGEKVVLCETVSNHSFFPMFRVDAEAYLYNELRLCGVEPPKKDNLQYFCERFHLWPYMRIRRRHTVECRKRGYYRIETVAVQTRDDEYFYTCPAEIYVYPMALPIEAVNEAAGRMQGDSRAVRPLFSDPFTLSGVRDYRFGDSVSSINFKASAKTGMLSGSSSPLKVNARDFCANRRLCVYMDFHLERDCGIDGAAYTRRCEVGLSYASAIIREAVYGGYAAGFYCNCRQHDGSMALRFPPEAGESQMLAVFRAMARMFFEDGASFCSLLDEAIENGVCDSEITCIVLCPTDKTESRLQALRELGNTVRLIVLSPMDEELYTD